jgi:hypothetical protein
MQLFSLHSEPLFLVFMLHSTLCFIPWLSGKHPFSSLDLFLNSYLVRISLSELFGT